VASGAVPPLDEYENDDIDGGDSAFSRIEFTADSSGTHYIRVRGFGFISPGGYAVGVY
jgi:hypothetical protein